jgi:hypothetical protein
MSVVTRGELDQLERHLPTLVCGQVLDLRLLAQEGGLVLRGYARTHYAKQRAQQLVMERTGLPIRANDIEVG